MAVTPIFYNWFDLPCSFVVYQRSPGDDILRAFRLSIERVPGDSLGSDFFGTAQQEHVAGTVRGQVAPVGHEIVFAVYWSDQRVGRYTGRLSMDRRIRGETEHIEGPSTPGVEGGVWWSEDDTYWNP